MKSIILFLTICLIVSCNSPEEQKDTVQHEYDVQLTNGAIVRTLQAPDLHVFNANDTICVYQMNDTKGWYVDETGKMFDTTIVKNTPVLLTDSTAISNEQIVTYRIGRIVNRHLL